MCDACVMHVLWRCDACGRHVSCMSGACACVVLCCGMFDRTGFVVRSVVKRHLLSLAWSVARSKHKVSVNESIFSDGVAVTQHLKLSVR